MTLSKFRDYLIRMSVSTAVLAVCVAASTLSIKAQSLDEQEKLFIGVDELVKDTDPPIR